MKLHICIVKIDKADLAGRVFKRGTYNMAVGLDFVSRNSGKVVGRYYITIGSGGPLKALVAEPEFLGGDAFGKYLCQEVFQQFQFIHPERQA